MSKKTTLKRLSGGLFALFSLLLAILIACTMLCYDWELLVDLKLGISSTGTVSGTDVTDESIYYKSSFGDISALYISESERTAAQQAALDEMQEALVEAEKAFCIREEEEGCVLLYNGEVGQEKALPLSSGNKVTLFGYAAGHPNYKSSSGGAASEVSGRTISLAQALRDNGFTLNETLQTALENTSSSARVSSSTNGKSDIGELDVSFYSGYQSTFSDYSDAAIVVLARTGGEGIDLNTTDADGVRQLALHEDEAALLRMIKSSGQFKKTIVLINSGYAMELGWLDEEEYGVDACLWIGEPGMYGFAGVANILSGDFYT